MDIKVGEYVRTNYGIIGKVGRIVTYERATYKNRYFTEYVEGNVTYNKLIAIQKHIVKHSDDLIDLIEIGDYVNGYKITLINEPSIANCYKRILYAEDENGYLIKSFSKDDIKSIVTKEQFESMSYKVGE